MGGFHCLVSVPLLRLIDGINITNSDEHMWLIPFSYGESHTLSVTFSEAQSIAGLRIWNYNKSPEDSYRGVNHLPSKLPYSVPSSFSQFCLPPFSALRTVFRLGSFFGPS